MSQADLNVANASGAAVRADINNQLLALGTWMSGATAPSPTFANMRWYDTSTGRVWLRDNANTAWLPWFALDANGRWTIDVGAASQDVIRIVNSTDGNALLFRVAGDAGKLVVYNSSAVAKAAITGGRLYLEGDDATGNEIGAIQESAEQTVTADTTVNVAHGLGQVPRNFWGVWRNKTTEFGYAVGDEALIIGDVGGDAGSTVVADATNVSLVMSAAPIRLVRKDTFNSGGATPANWAAVLRWTI